MHKKKKRKQKQKNNFYLLAKNFLLQVKYWGGLVFGSLPFWGSALVVYSIILFVAKGFLLSHMSIVYTNTIWETIKRYLARVGNDLLFVFLVRIIAGSGMYSKYKGVKIVCVLASIVLLGIYSADFFAMRFLRSRFTVEGISFFSLENIGPYITDVFLAIIARIVGLIACVLASRVLAKRYINQHIFRTLRYVLVGVMVMFGLSFVIHVTSPYQHSVLEMMMSFDDWGSQKNDKSYESYYHTFAGKNQKSDVILVFAESFSTVDSQYAGGMNNLLSGFDTIARAGTLYTNFAANGCTSDTAHIAVLQGIQPWETPQIQQDYMRYKSYTLSLPAFFQQQGYHTTFLSTAPLDFLGQKDFLTSMQFDTIVGSEAFRSRPKYVFRAAPDEALYKQAEKTLLQQSDSPRFVVMQTISSHKPYNSPAGDTEAQAFRYSDDQLLQFYHSLQAMHYFDHGILIVVGDHRKMQAMGYDEIQRRGKAAYGKALLAVVGKGVPAHTIVSTPEQHLDIFSSLKHLIASGDVLLDSYYNDIFGGYQGRDTAVRYCQFVDKQYVASRADGSSWTVTPQQHNDLAEYIRAFYQFQQGTPYQAKKQVSSVSTGVAQFPGLMRVVHHGLSLKAPPNSLDSFQLAYEHGAEGIEMDVSFTDDGYPVVIHGPDLGRIKCDVGIGKKNVREFTLQDMKDHCKLYNGQVILTLQETLTKIAGKFKRYFVDVKIDNPKEKAFIKPMLQSIKQLDLRDNIMFSSTDSDVNYQLGATKDIVAGWEINDLSPVPTILESNSSFVLMPRNIITPEVVTTLLNAKKQPIAYVVNTGADMRQLYDWGVRYFLTDTPDDLVK